MARPWQRVTVEEIPPEWRRAQDEAAAMPEATLQALRQRMGVAAGTPMALHIVCEIPDFPIARAWEAWYTTQEANTGGISILRTAQEQWRDRPEALRATLASLISEGRPTPVWAAAWSVRQPTQQ